jgi:hypothetical protein
MRLTQLFKLGLFAFLSACCGYLPFVDRPISGDFERQQYVFDKGDHTLIETDSVSIDINGETLIPNRCRSKKLKSIYCVIKLDIKKYLFNERLVIPLDVSKITCTDGTNTITGDAKIIASESIPILSIQEQGYYLMQNSLRKDSLVFKFDFSHLKTFNYNNQVVKLDLGNLKLPNGKIIKSKEVICRFQQKI